MVASVESFWFPYILSDYAFADFSTGSRVVDVGCGPGAQLVRIVAEGCRAVGVEIDQTSLEACRKLGLTVVRARAEALPFRTGTLDGLICKVVLPYTDENRALGEFARILKPRGTACVVCHGLGFYIRYLAAGPGWKLRLYALRSIVNTWLYAVSGWRLPGFLGDTLYQARGRLARAYRRFGLRVTDDARSPSFLGLSVFIYHKIERVE